MYIQQADLTRGIGRDFVKALTAISVKEAHEQGTLLFRKGDPANYAYLLLMGRVLLKMGETGQVVHIVSRPGETFGWSSLAGRDVFSSTAECVMQTHVRSHFFSTSGRNAGRTVAGKLRPLRKIVPRRNLCIV